MSFDDVRKFAEAIGWPMAIMLFVGVILAKNGLINISMRDGYHEKIKALEDKIHEIETEIAVLKDRWARK